MGSENEQDMVHWSDEPKYNNRYDWDNTITIPVGIYHALERIQIAANALMILWEGVEEEVRLEKRQQLFIALQHYERMKTLQREKALFGIFSWEEKDT